MHTPHPHPTQLTFFGAKANGIYDALSSGSSLFAPLSSTQTREPEPATTAQRACFIIT
jgi:hypothetical protein